MAKKTKTVQTNLFAAFTAQVYQIARAPKKLKLLGDKRHPESAQHVIEFPGGAIELSRTSDNLYWAHIVVNDGQIVPDAEGTMSALGQVVASRIDYADDLIDIPNEGNVHQIAVLIATRGEQA